MLTLTAATFVCSQRTVVVIFAFIRYIWWTRVFIIDTHSIWVVASWEICKSEFVVNMKYCELKAWAAYPYGFVIKFFKETRGLTGFAPLTTLDHFPLNDLLQFPYVYTNLGSSERMLRFPVWSAAGKDKASQPCLTWNRQARCMTVLSVNTSQETLIANTARSQKFRTVVLR